MDFENNDGKRAERVWGGLGVLREGEDGDATPLAQHCDLVSLNGMINDELTMD